MAEQMDLTTRPTFDHRKHAFSQIGSHISWPTPPTELEHEFPISFHDMSSDEKSARLMPDLNALGSDRPQIPAIAPFHSPPASPEQAHSELLPPIRSPSPSIVDESQQLPPIQDRQLFAQSDSKSSQLPLFASPSIEDDRADSLSPAGRAATPVATKQKLIPAEPAAEPKCTWRGIYSIFPHFQSVDRDFFRRYRQSCYGDVKRIPAWRPSDEPGAVSSAAAPTYWSTPLAPGRTRNRVTKPRDRSPPLAKAAAQPKRRVATASAADVPRVSSALPSAAKAKPIARTRERQSASAEPATSAAARKRAPPSKAVIIDDWQQIPDYAPPTSTLNSTNRLKVTWKGVPNVLSNDADAAQLHAQEVEVAQILKLPASQYLANKRRIFEARLKSIKEHKNFTKTAAQQACNIDVNKTSQLYEAYTRVGWFDEAHFQQFLV